MKEFKVTERQLDALKKHTETMRETAQAFYDGDGVNIENYERTMAAWKETSAELGYLIEDIEGQEAAASIDKSTYMFRRAGTAELEVIAHKWAEYFDADITIRRDNEGKNIDKKISLAEAEIGMIYAYLVALTRTCTEDEEDGGPSISEMIAIVLFCAANHIKRKDLSEADYDVLFRGLDEYFRGIENYD